MRFPSLDRLTSELSKFPGVGPKSAGRLAFYILELDEHQTGELVDSIIDFKNKAGFCPKCGNLAQDEDCAVCNDPSRNHDTLCVVETVRDLFSIEKTGQFNGLYQVLGGSLAPLDGIGPEKLQIAHLVARLQSMANSDQGLPNEIILATNPTLEGDATAHYVADLLTGQFPGLTISRIAHGIQTGGELEFADASTLGRSISERRPYSAG